MTPNREEERGEKSQLDVTGGKRNELRQEQKIEMARQKRRRTGEPN